MKAFQHVPNQRRYALLRAFKKKDENVGEFWRSKQRAIPGTALPEGFPLQVELAACGYYVVEDLDGAVEEELREAGLTASQAKAVLAAFAALPPAT